MSPSLLAKKVLALGAGVCGLPYILKNRVAIFMFHRVVSAEYYNKTVFQKSLMVTDGGFRSFLERLKGDFTIVPLSALVERGQPHTISRDRPAAVLTFDDGWGDNYRYAYPVLRDLGLPATIFVSLDYIGKKGGFWWQDLGELLTAPYLADSIRSRVLEYVRQSFVQPAIRFDVFQYVDLFIELIKHSYATEAERICDELYELAGWSRRNDNCLDWQQCQQMSEGGIEFGSHTLSHPRLSTLDDVLLERELCESKRVLLASGVRYVDTICYPYGDYDGRVLRYAGKYYRSGLTVRSGIVPKGSDCNMTLPRINIPTTVACSRSLLQYRLLKAAMRSLVKA